MIRRLLVETIANQGPNMSARKDRDDRSTPRSIVAILLCVFNRFQAFNQWGDVLEYSCRSMQSQEAFTCGNSDVEKIRISRRLEPAYYKYCM